MPVYSGLENWLRRNGLDRETQELADAGEVDHGAMEVEATVAEHVLERAEVKRERIGSTSQSQSPALATTSSILFSLEPSPPQPPSPDDRLAPHWPNSKPAAATATDSSAIPPKFRPLVDYLQQKQVEGSPRVLLSRVALDLSKQDVKPSFSAHWKAALKLGIVKRAGPAQDWIELVVRFTCPSICRCKAVLTHDTRRRRFRRSFRLLPLPRTCQPEKLRAVDQKPKPTPQKVSKKISALRKRSHPLLEFLAADDRVWIPRTEVAHQFKDSGLYVNFADWRKLAVTAGLMEVGFGPSVLRRRVRVSTLCRR